jgi:putative ABC transport system substrate-binding protein
MTSRKFQHRRLALGLALGAPLLAPLGAFAQPERIRRLGILVPSGSQAPNNMDGFFQGMRELGYVQGRNLVVETRFGEGRDAALPALAAELVKLEVEVILAAGPAATSAAKRATSTVPIVMGTVDPVEQGLIASLSQPGGNMTGWCLLSTESAQKQLALFREAVPQAMRVGVVASPTMTRHITRAGELARGARALGVSLSFLEVPGPEALEPIFAAMRKERLDGFIVMAEPAIDRLRDRLAALASQHRLPAMYYWRFYVDAGGLMSYGANLRDMVALWPGYVDKILKGARPGDIPVQTPTKYELVLNQKAARDMGFTFPGSLVIAADAVIT